MGWLIAVGRQVSVGRSGWVGCVIVALVAGGPLAGREVALGVNQPPVANAGPDRYMGADPVVLDGTRSYDPDPGDTLVYEWTQVSGPTVTMTGADTATPSVQVAQTSAIQTVVLQLVVHDGALAYSPPATVTVKVVPTIPSSIELYLENPPFDPNKPTFVYFGGGNCHSGGGCWCSGTAWESKANIISWSYMPPYQRCGDSLIVYLNSVAPDYDQPIETAGFSTGGMPAIEAAIWINTEYNDPRYAVNQVAFLDAACDVYSEWIPLFVGNPVGGEPAWVENFYVEGGLGHFLSQAVNIHMTGSHGTAVSYYEYSISPDMFPEGLYNHGVMASAAFSSAFAYGRNYHIVSPSSSPYHFNWVGNAQQGQMQYFDQARYPGALPEPVVLIGPADGAVVGTDGMSMSCEPSEHSVAYNVMFGRDKRNLATIYTSTTPPVVSTGLLAPGETFYWTIQARDTYGSSYRADVRSVTGSAGVAGDFNGDGLVDSADSAILNSAFLTSWGGMGFFVAADFDGDGTVTCSDRFTWLNLYRTFQQNPGLLEPLGSDADLDGVVDTCDACPRSLQGTSVGWDGCSQPTARGDVDRDGDVDQSDFGLLQACLLGVDVAYSSGCTWADLDEDGDVDGHDVAVFKACRRGMDVPGDPTCGQ